MDIQQGLREHRSFNFIDSDEKATGQKLCYNGVWTIYRAKIIENVSSSWALTVLR